MNPLERQNENPNLDPNDAATSLGFLNNLMESQIPYMQLDEGMSMEAPVKPQEAPEQELELETEKEPPIDPEAIKNEIKDELIDEVKKDLKKMLKEEIKKLLDEDDENETGKNTE